MKYIYWKTKDPEIIKDIRSKFNLPPGMTINGETPCEIQDSEIDSLREFEKLGYIKIRFKQ